MSKNLSANLDKLVGRLVPFGLAPDEALVYLYLVGKSEQSPLSISRATTISRTKVYVILDSLMTKSLVGEQGGKYARRYFALPYTQLEQLIRQKRQEVEMLESSTQSLFDELSTIELPRFLPSQVKYFRGIDGLKQVTWNSTRAQGTLRVFEAANDMSAFLDFDFSERVRIEFVKRGLGSSLQVTNFATIRPWTNIDEFIKVWQPRYISPKELRISTEIVMYNDIVAMYQLHKEEVFCVEIQNNALSEMKKNLFDFVWARSRVMKKKGERGEAVL